MVVGGFSWRLQLEEKRGTQDWSMVVEFGFVTLDLVRSIT